MTDTDATREGASQPVYEQAADTTVELTKTEAPELEGRDAVEEAAAKKARAAQDKKMREAMGIPEEEPPGDDGKVGEGESDTVVETKEDPVRDDKGRFAPKQEGKPSASEDDPLIPVKVDGVERMLPLSEVRAGYQRAQAANRRFEEAAQMRARAEQLYGQAQSQPEQKPAPQAQSSAPGAAPDVDLEALAERLTYGTKDDVKAALQALIGARPATTAATPEIVEQVVQQRLAQFQQQSEARRELEAFSGKHSDLAKDPDLAELVGRRAAQLMAEELVQAGAPPSVVATLNPAQVGHYHAQLRAASRGRDAQELLDEAAIQIRRKFNLPKPGQATPSASKVDAKRALQKQPAAVTARAPSAAPPKPRSASDIIAEERRARGLP